MAVIVWTDQMSVGVEVLDQHHKRLVDLLNQLHAAIVTGDVDEVTGVVFGELVRYVFYHFAEEERLMVAAGYEDVAAHCQSHRVLAEQVRRLEREYDENPVSGIAEETHAFLADWLVHHIGDEDMRYRSVMANLPQEA